MCSMWEDVHVVLSVAVAAHFLLSQQFKGYLCVRQASAEQQTPLKKHVQNISNKLAST